RRSSRRPRSTTRRALVPAPDRLQGLRVVADPAALDAAVAALPAGTVVVRFAPDEALLVGITGMRLDDPHAIVEPDVGYVAITADRDAVERHVEWALPAAGETAQGSIAGVPAKLAWLPDGRAWIVT